jgi:hypothetical protein
MPAGETIRSMLAGGDRRSIGRVNEVVDLVRLKPSHANRVFQCLWDPDACVRMRAADALEKLSRQRPHLLQTHRKQLLDLLAETNQKEMRWHLAIMIARLRLTASECQQAKDLLLSYLEDKSSIVKTCAMQGLADLTLQCPGLHALVLDQLRSCSRMGTPAMRARGRILLDRMEQERA